VWRRKAADILSKIRGYNQGQYDYGTSNKDGRDTVLSIEISFYFVPNKIQKICNDMPKTVLRILGKQEEMI
jgi:hypothetical protein